MFDEDPVYTSEVKSSARVLLEAKNNRKLKKELFAIAREQYSDPVKFQVWVTQMDYYRCVNSALKSDSLSGPSLDQQILVCKTPLTDMLRHIEKTNEHAHIKVKRCVRSKRSWAERNHSSQADIEASEWDCLNRYHRRYLYYYPRLRDEQYARYYA